MGEEIASEVVAKYALKGPREELERTLPLDQGELLILSVICQTAVGGWSLGARRSFIRISSRQVCIVRRFGLVRDRILVVPAGAITSVDGGGPTESAEITFNADGGEQSIAIVNWRQPREPIDRQLLNSPDLDEMLRHVALRLLSNDR